MQEKNDGQLLSIFQPLFEQGNCKAFFKNWIWQFLKVSGLSPYFMESVCHLVKAKELSSVAVSQKLELTQKLTGNEGLKLSRHQVSHGPLVPWQRPSPLQCTNSVCLRVSVLAEQKMSNITTNNAPAETSLGWKVTEYCLFKVSCSHCWVQFARHRLVRKMLQLKWRIAFHSSFLDKSRFYAPP